MTSNRDRIARAYGLDVDDLPSPAEVAEMARRDALPRRAPRVPLPVVTDPWVR